MALKLAYSVNWTPGRSESHQNNGIEVGCKKFSGSLAELFSSASDKFAVLWAHQPCVQNRKQPLLINTVVDKYYRSLAVSRFLTRPSWQGALVSEHKPAMHQPVLLALIEQKIKRLLVVHQLLILAPCASKR